MLLRVRNAPHPGRMSVSALEGAAECFLGVVADSRPIDETETSVVVSNYLAMLPDSPDFLAQHRAKLCCSGAALGSGATLWAWWRLH